MMSNIKCAVTKMSTIVGDAGAKAQFETLLKLQWVEVDHRRKTSKLAVDFDKYIQMEEAGVHFMVVAYEGESLLGYNSVFLTPSPHTGELTALTDTIFVKREYRKGSVGKELIGLAEGFAKEKGAKHFMVTFKNDKPHDNIVEELGFFSYETVYAKYIGD